MTTILASLSTCRRAPNSATLGVLAIVLLVPTACGEDAGLPLTLEQSRKLMTQDLCEAECVRFLADGKLDKTADAGRPMVSLSTEVRGRKHATTIAAMELLADV